MSLSFVPFRPCAIPCLSWATNWPDVSWAGINQFLSPYLPWSPGKEGLDSLLKCSKSTKWWVQIKQILLYAVSFWIGRGKGIWIVQMASFPSGYTYGIARIYTIVSRIDCRSTPHIACQQNEGKKEIVLAGAFYGKTSLIAWRFVLAGSTVDIAIITAAVETWSSKEIMHLTNERIELAW